MRKGGRKIKRSKSLYGSRHRSKLKSIITAVIMIVIIGGLLFLGYSIGEPVINYFKNKASNDQSTSSEPWSPSDVTLTSSDSESSSQDSSSENNSSGENNVSNTEFTAYTLTEQDLLTEQSLLSALNTAKSNGYSAVAVILKSQGGAINYKSTIELANKASTITSELSAARIAEIINENDMKSIAIISTLYDSLTPMANKLAGYLIESSESAWYDNSVAKGGKPWLNPFSDIAKQYLTSLSSEICPAGFDEIVCSDVEFPPFRNTDLNYIGATVKDANRYTALINVVDIFKNNVSDISSQIGLEVSAKGIIDGTEEVFKPDMLTGIKAVVDYNSTEIGDKITVGDTQIVLTDLSVYDRVKTVYENVKAKSGNLEIIPCINNDETDFDEIIRAITDSGYKNYIVK